MRASTVVAASLVFGGCGPAAQRGVLAASQPEFATAQLAVFADSILAAARARDPVRFSGYFATGDDLTYVINTRTLRSHGAVASAFTALLGKQREFDVRWTGDRRVVVLARDAAVVTGGFQTTARDTSGAAWGARGVITFAARRDEAGWRVVHWHTSEVPTTP